jgi:hypothetical protein
LGTSLFNLSGTGDVLNPFDSGNKNDGFYVQGGYKFNGRTLVGGGYGRSREKLDFFGFGPGWFENNMWTVGVYHDVNSWLKLVAEYSDSKREMQSLGLGAGAGELKARTFSVGGFLLW